MPEFAAFALAPRAPLHLGSRRAGVVARTHRHVPGHLFSHALAAVAGARRGSTPTVFAEALAEITARFRFGPAFFIRGERRLDEAEIESRLLRSSHHVTLAQETRAALDTALFEVEYLQVPGEGDVQLCGGVWHDRDDLDGRPLADWLSMLRLGGELKTGFGRVACVDWLSNANSYPGVGPCAADGVRMGKGEVLPGASLDGVEDAPLVPWLGRRHDTRRGFGRRLSNAALVRMDARVSDTGRFLPCATDPGLGCWTRQP